MYHFAVTSEKYDLMITNACVYICMCVHYAQDALMRAWPLVGEAMEDPTVEPFEKANGESAIAYYMKRPDVMSLIYKSLAGMSVPFTREMLERYDGFKGVETLVDVGGNSGVTLRMIMEKYPNVRRGINYDLPDMVSSAPLFPGIYIYTHVTAISGITLLIASTFF